MGETFRVTAPIYYALKDAVRPMRYSIYSVVINLAANLIFIQKFGFAGLAAATSLGGLVNFGLLLFNMPKHIPTLKVWPSLYLLFKTGLASISAALFLYLLQKQTWFIAIGGDLWHKIIQLIVLAIFGAVSYLLVAFALGVIPKIKK